jgi:hypothetical protein
MSKYQLQYKDIKINVLDELTFEFLFHVVATIEHINEECMFEFIINKDHFVFNPKSKDEHSLNCFVINWLAETKSLILEHHLVNKSVIVFDVIQTENFIDNQIVEDFWLNHTFMDELTEINLEKYDIYYQTIRDLLSNVDDIDGDVFIDMKTNSVPTTVYVVEGALNTQNGLFFAYDSLDRHIIKYANNRGFDDCYYAHCYTGIAVIDDSEDLIVMELNQGRLISVNKINYLQMVSDWLFGLVHISDNEITDETNHIVIEVNEQVNIDYQNKTIGTILPIISISDYPILEVFTYQGLMNIKTVLAYGNLAALQFVDLVIEEDRWFDAVVKIVGSFDHQPLVGVRYPQFQRLFGINQPIGLINELNELDEVIHRYIDQQQAINEQYIID